MKAPASVEQGRGVAFELVRFELVGDRLQLQGRWFGVRGRRFMRPDLTAVVDGKSIRLLADLVDKPWPAEDGEPWKAAFPYALERAQLREAELTVAPDVTITLPAPRRPSVASRKKSAKSRDEVDSDALPHGLAELQQAHRQLRRQLDRIEAEKAQTALRLDEMSRGLHALTIERDEAIAARDRIADDLEVVQCERDEILAERDVARLERDQVADDRDAALRARDQALQESEAARGACDRALSDHGAALAAQRQAVSERDEAIAALERAEAARDAALSLRDQARAERDEGLVARDEAASAREELSRANEHLQSELADLRSARGAALVMRRAAQAPATSGRHARILPRAIAIAVVLAIVISLLIVLRVL
jgi:hypothetical protein